MNLGSFLPHPPFSQTASIDPRLTYGNTHTYNGGYNTDWGTAQQQALIHNANHLMGEVPSAIPHHANQLTAGLPSAAGAAATTNNHNYQCKWAMGGLPCDQGFGSFEELMVHEGSAHGVQGPASQKIVCRWMTNGVPCNKPRRRHGFRRHIGTHVGLSVLCTVCSKPFSRKDSMRAHLKKEHSGK